MFKVVNIEKPLDLTEQFNEDILKMLSNYLTNAPDFIKTDVVEEISRECGVTQEYAFSVLLAAACGLDTENNVQDETFFHRYFLDMIHQLSVEQYEKNPYYRKIQIPDLTNGDCELKHEKYQPYEAFVCDDIKKYQDGRQIPQIGFFEREFTYPAILEKGRIWMTVTPNEIETMRPAVANAFGEVLTFGLGLGYFAYMVSEKPEVKSVTVVEQNEQVINLFRTYILPQFQHGDKVNIIQGDAFLYAKNELKKHHYDFAYTDLWHDVSDGIGMYLQMKEYEQYSSDTKFMYWIEPSILCYL